ncbi:alkaline phosphatase [Halobacillus amylolyticus]|uniref:Alkaline phosphatase n=1 Tax=Halobacillus amylolyticus TaxID=2932259 RepID=A0ABY4HF58_9BACI|nr:alkaline phosphatase [Halobacillus amylolyticus]UOR12540.1 alkaline phosphatase [Halobacillus amylolyticus]
MTIKKKVLGAVFAGFILSGGTYGLFNDKVDSILSADSEKEKQEVVDEVDKHAPKNVIVMVGDGMGVGQLEIARLMEHGKDGQLFMESLENVALMHTYSANNFATDSAAAGTAIATGEKTNNESIGVDAEGNEVDSILDLYQDAGKKVGVISTNTVTDATPAAFTGSAANRWSGQEEIARQMLTNEYDVLLGGGASYFGPGKQNGKDLVEAFEDKGYSTVSTEEGLENVENTEKLLGLFSPSYMSYKTDRDELNSKEPSLQEMTDKAIEVLSNDKDGFFLMVEGARIDHAAHAGDATGVWKETIEFDQTVRQVVTWAEQRKDTLVVVLADHETMGMSATEPMNIEALKDIEVSPEYMAGKLIKDGETQTFTTESVKQVFKEYADIELSDEEVQEFLSNVKNNDGDVYAAYRVGWEIGSVIASHYHVGVVDTDTRAASSTGGHTGNMVPVFATGAGSDDFEGVLDNTEIMEKIANSAKFKAKLAKENSKGK